MEHSLSFVSFLFLGHASYSVRTGGYWCGEIAVVFWSYREISTRCFRKECVEVYLYYMICFNATVYNDVQRQPGLHHFDRALRKTVWFLSMENIPLSHRGFFTYLLFYHLKILHSAHTVYLCVLFGIQNKQQVFPYRAISSWFLNTLQVIIDLKIGIFI